MCKQNLYAVWKQTLSKPKYEDEWIHHIATEDSKGEPVCGIHKRFPGAYNIGFEPLKKYKSQKADLCKLCFRIISNGQDNNL